MPERKGDPTIEGRVENRPLRTERVLEIQETGMEQEAKRESPTGNEAEDKARIAELKQTLQGEVNPHPSPTKKEIGAYIEKYLPEHFKEVSSLTRFHMFASRVTGAWWKRKGEFGVEGREHIPTEGPMLVVANHYRWGDETRIRAAMDRPTYVVGADIHFEGPKIKRWFLEKMGFIPVQSSLSNLTEEEKLQLLKNVPEHEKPYYQKVVDRDKKPNLSAQRQFVRTVVALLAKGEPVTLLPEGLWIFEEGGKPQKQMRKAYSGIEVIAREYKKVTGKDLPVLPLAITDAGVEAQEIMTLGENKTIHDVMREIAKHLPEDERGYYKEE